MITKRNILRHELIGLPVTLVQASNPRHQGITGIVLDETRNTLRIGTETGVLMVPKYSSIFRFTLPDGTLVDVDGSAMVMQPERRITLKTQNVQRIK